jgi:LysR family transcriptional regulator, transcriptional activator of the cysJI operon
LYLQFIINGFKIRNTVEKNSYAIDFRHLESFCRVADLKNFSKAAEDLLLTQPTISGHILALEHSLSLRLFDRTSREARLTKAGRILHQYASKLLATRKEALNALSEFSEGIRGELSVGASTLPGEYLLPRLLADFKREFPNLAFSLRIADTRKIVQHLLDGDVDFAVIGGKLKHPSLHYDLFAEDEIIVVGPPSRASRERKVRFDEIFDEPWILREEGSGTQMAVEEALKKKGRNLRQMNAVMEMGNASALKEAVKAGLGLAFVSGKSVEEDLSSRSLCRVEVDGLDPISRPVYTVFHLGRTLSPVGERFLRFLEKRKEPRPR